MKLIGRFPNPMPEEMAQRAKEMLQKVYQAGFFGELCGMQDGIKVLVPWEQSEMVVLPYSRTSVPVVCQTPDNGRLEGWICETDAIRAADHPYITVTMRAAYLLCEYLFPGVYADLDLHDKKNQEAFIFLKRLLRAEDMDALLRHRMDDAAIWQACRSSGDEEPVQLYERIALAPEPSVLAKCLEEEEEEIDDENEKMEWVKYDERRRALDRKFPCEQNTTLAFTFFMLCLRHALLERFDFSKAAQKTVVRAALFLNGIRNGGKMEDLESLRLPYHVSQRLLAVDWKTITELLAFLSRLPVDQVRELTAHTVLQRGEIIRNTARTLVRKQRYLEIETACQDKGEDCGYFKTEKRTWKYEDFCKKMQNSAIFQDTLYDSCEEACPVKAQEILRSLNEIGISVTKGMYLALRMQYNRREAYAKLLSIEVLARRQDGSWDQKILLDMLKELDDPKGVQAL